MFKVKILKEVMFSESLLILLEIHDLFGITEARNFH